MIPRCPILFWVRLIQPTWSIFQPGGRGRLNTSQSFLGSSWLTRKLGALGNPTTSHVSGQRSPKRQSFQLFQETLWFTGLHQQGEKLSRLWFQGPRLAWLGPHWFRTGHVLRLIAPLLTQLQSIDSRSIPTPYCKPKHLYAIEIIARLYISIPLICRTLLKK